MIEHHVFQIVQNFRIQIIVDQDTVIHTMRNESIIKVIELSIIDEKYGHTIMRRVDHVFQSHHRKWISTHIIRIQ